MQQAATAALPPYQLQEAHVQDVAVLKGTSKGLCDQAAEDRRVDMTAPNQRSG
jgi:hypothetical protein